MALTFSQPIAGPEYYEWYANKEKSAWENVRTQETEILSEASKKKAKAISRGKAAGLAQETITQKVQEAEAQRDKDLAAVRRGGDYKFLQGGHEAAKTIQKIVDERGPFAPPSLVARAEANPPGPTLGEHFAPVYGEPEVDLPQPSTAKVGVRQPKPGAPPPVSPPTEPGGGARAGAVQRPGVEARPEGGPGQPAFRARAYGPTTKTIGVRRSPSGGVRRLLVNPWLLRPEEQELRS